MEKIIVKRGEPIKIIVQPKKVEIIEHKIVNPESNILPNDNTEESESK